VRKGYVTEGDEKYLQQFIVDDAATFDIDPNVLTMFPHNSSADFHNYACVGRQLDIDVDYLISRAAANDHLGTHQQ